VFFNNFKTDFRIPPLVRRLILRNNQNLSNTLNDLDRFQLGETPSGQSLFRPFIYGRDESIGDRERLRRIGRFNDNLNGFDQFF
jgi:hypothetical protein